MVTALSLSLALLGHTGDTPKLYKLMVGDPAPPITISATVKGKTVKEFERGKVYVLDFWATWCGPCKRSIPHLNTLVAKLGDKFTLIGVSVWERKLTGVSSFAWGHDSMNYTVVADDVAPAPRTEKNLGSWAYYHGKMSQNWLKESGRGDIGIPEIFIVDQQGRIAWIGDPSAVDKPLEQVIDGTYDLNAESAKYALTMKHFKDGRKIAADLDKQETAKHWDAAIKDCEKLLALDPDFYSSMALEKFTILLVHMGKEDEAYAYARSVESTIIAADWDSLRLLAETVVDPESKIKNRDYDFALDAVNRGIAATVGSKTYMYTTMAKIYRGKGDWAKALASLDVAKGMATIDEMPGVDKMTTAYIAAAAAKKPASGK